MIDGHVYDIFGATSPCFLFFFFFNDTATTEIYTLSLHDALPVWRFLLDQRGLIDSLLTSVHLPAVLWLVDGKLPLVSVALVNSWVAVPFATIVYRAALLDVPREVIEAAAVDGAVPGQIIRHIILPLLRPVMIVLAVITVVYAFRSFDFIYIMTSGGPGTV